MHKKKNLVFYWEKPSEFDEMNEEIEFKFFDDNQSIPVNIEETEKRIKIKASLPDFKKDEINLNLTNTNLEISVCKNQQSFGKNRKTFMQEKYYNVLKETFTLPDRIDPDTAFAKLENGFLIIEMEKSSVKNKKKKLNIK